jgi:esterase
MKLNYKSYGNGSPLLILHGFMGSLDNWHTLANQFAKDFQVFTIDQRNHGKSPHSNEHSIPLMVADLLEFLNDHNLHSVSIIGHSMGGKVAMQFALSYPDMVKNLIVVDIAPKQYKRGHDDVFEAIFAVDLPQVTGRKDAENMMEPFVQDFGTRQFLMKNLERNSDGNFGWKVNLDILHRDYDEIIKPIISEIPFTGKTLVIKGGNSRYISLLDEEDFRNLFPNYQLMEIANAGHWVHAEAPNEFYNSVVSFLLKSV